MSGKWVDNTTYFGPDRRRNSQRRLLNRRKRDEAGDLPSLGALLRRLRVQLVTQSDEQRSYALGLASAAATKAKALGQTECAVLINRAANAIARSARDPAAAAEAEQLLIEALTLAR